MKGFKKDGKQSGLVECERQEQACSLVNNCVFVNFSFQALSARLVTVSYYIKNIIFQIYALQLALALV